MLQRSIRELIFFDWFSLIPILEKSLKLVVVNLRVHVQNAVVRIDFDCSSKPLQENATLPQQGFPRQQRRTGRFAKPLVAAGMIGVIVRLGDSLQGEPPAPEESQHFLHRPAVHQ